MSRLTRWLAPRTIAHAHCDLPCGVYDPEQARIEAESCFRIMEKYQANTDATFRARAIGIKEERAELVKHHLDVLWHDYFKPEHLEKVPNLHELFWNATKQVSKVKALGRSGRRPEAARPDQRGRRRLEGHRRTREDAGRRPTGLTLAVGHSEAPSFGGASPFPGSLAGRRRRSEHASGHRARRLAAGRPDRRPLAAPRQRRAVPRTRGRDAGDQARGGRPGRSGPVRRRLSRAGRGRSLADRRREPGDTAAAGFGDPVDSRRYGPVQLDLLVGRAWFRYAPLPRIGRIARPEAPATAASLERFDPDRT